MSILDKAATVIVLTFCVTSAAWSNGNDDGCRGNCGSGGEQSQDQSQDQSQAQAQSQTAVGVGTGGDGGDATGGNSQGGSASATGGNASANNRLSNVGNWDYRESERPVDSAYAPSISPTSPCMGSSSAGGQGMSFGIAIGSSWRDRECEKREAFRMGMESGDSTIRELAVQVYRNLDVVQEVISDKANQMDNLADSLERSIPGISDTVAASLPHDR